MKFVIANRSSRNPNGYADLVSYVRRDILNGREHLVAAVTMIIRGVHHGSQGALFYSKEELETCCNSWNGVPILLGHSAGTGRTPDIINRYGVGVVYNTRFMLDRLRADAWLDVEKLRRLAPDALGKIERKEHIEVSTGLNCAFVNAPGVFNGKSYDRAVQGIRPDHLAIFVNGEVGACSVNDGCGINNHRGCNCGSDSPLLCTCNPPTPIGLPEMEFEPLQPPKQEQQRLVIRRGNRSGNKPEPLGLPDMEFNDETIAKALSRRR